MKQPVGIAVRAYAQKENIPISRPPKKHIKKKSDLPSEWVLVYDTETTTDETQNMRFGSYQIRKNDLLDESGVFYDPEILTKSEQTTLKKYTEKHQLKFMTVREFVDEIFYPIGYECRATIVGFNLPFDISRLAIAHSPARSSPWNKVMRGGFSFKMSENEKLPRVQIKHVSSRDAFIQFAAPKRQRTTRGSRKKERFEPVRRGYFIDLKNASGGFNQPILFPCILGQVFRGRSPKA